MGGYEGHRGWVNYLAVDPDFQRRGFGSRMMAAIEVALRKRQVEPERVERMINGIVRQLESSGEAEIQSSIIGEYVMEALRGVDPVAYVRFASVYRDFREAADFQEVLGEIAREDSDGGSPQRTQDKR